jgi:predicted AlkP superfamily phosphohydrolase/phosphomutase
MSDRKVLVIALDSAELGLVQRLMSENLMPSMASLVQRGRWTRVDSVAHIGSGAVWPSFFTGLTPNEHGQYGEWRWDPSTMAVRRFTGEGLVPFWKQAAESGARVGVLDVPFAPLIGLREGFEISEWGAHDVITTELRFGPPGIARHLSRLRRHPYEAAPPNPRGPHDTQGLRKLYNDSLEGIRLRGELARALMTETSCDLSVIVFPELHHVGHVMWHSVEPDHWVYGDISDVERFPLTELYVEADKELGKFLEAWDESSSVMVVSLHGMEPGRWYPQVLPPFLREKGYSYPTSWQRLTWTERKAAAFAKLKEKAPQWVKDVYHSRADLSTQLRLARPTMLELQDWRRTQVIALPSDVHGWLRINLADREARGVVHPSDYISLSQEIEVGLSNLTSSVGDTLVESVLIPARDLAITEPKHVKIPDLIVRWTPAAYDPRDFPIEAHQRGQLESANRTGRHTSHAFCVTAGPITEHMPDTMRTEDLHRAILKVLGSEPVASRAAR